MIDEISFLSYVFTGWTISTLALMLLIVGLLLGIRRRLASIEQKQCQQTTDIFQLALAAGRLSIPVSTEAKRIDVVPKRTRRKKLAVEEKK